MKFSCCKLPTDGLGQIILAAWLIFSIVFVGNSLWQGYKQNQLQQAVTAAYQQAQADMVGQLIEEANKCVPFPVNLGETSIELQKLGCE